MSSATETSRKYVLGLDLGSASLGWATIALNAADEPASLICAGVRIFEPGVDGTSLEIEQGKDQSKAVERRTARLQRRQLRRRVARQRELFGELQRAGLLPVDANGKGTGSEQRHFLLNDLDRSLTTKFLSQGEIFTQSPLYFLRKRALDHPLEPYELGRVLFHMSQRRGFKSNRKETKKTAKENEELGQVKADIHSLELAMQEAGARTLGEYFAGLDPHTEKVRRRWTARRMFEDEFAKIWTAQQPHHASTLTQELHDRVRELLFFQRPIASQKHLVGTCELERGDDKHPPKRRAPWATMAAQRFRMLQKINDLVVIDPKSQTSRKLTPEERTSLYHLLDRKGTQSYAAIRKHLGLKGTTFNLEAGGDKDLPGNRTQKSMRKVFGDAWDSFTDGKQTHIIDNWRNSESDDALIQDATQHLGLNAEAAAVLVNEKPQSDYCALSLTAIAKLMPLMLEGQSFKEAETAVYGSRFSGLPIHETLPPVRQVLPTLRNPAVERALTELRKVVNAVVREYGKPYEIRIELARELKKPRQERVKATTNNRKREAENKALAKRMADECGIQNPSRKDMEKAKLWVEQQGECPYTGKHLSFSRLFADPEFDVDHILPISRHPDDSYQNKVLCCLEENRMYKRNQTPYEAYATDAERWRGILARVAKWNNPGKLRKFEIATTDELEAFSERQLNDTRYTSVLAGRLLALLYGGRDLATASGNRQVVFATSGAVTATLRRNWGFERILQGIVQHEAGETRGKPRTDHRHHAVDAITIALTRQSVVQSMARASSLEPWQPGTRSWRHIPKPWTTPNFEREMTAQVEGMVVSHRPEHKMSGALHDETNYGRPKLAAGKTVVHVRKPIGSLSAQDIESIVDPAIRTAVRTKQEGIGGDLKKCESSNDWPALAAKNGKSVPIKRARIQKVLEVTPIASGDRQRFVALANNHHTAIFSLLENDRETRWEGLPASLYEVTERKRRNIGVIQKTHPDGPVWKFKFSLMGGDMIELHRNCDHRNGRCVPEIYRIRTIAGNGQLSIVKITDARLIKDIKTAKEWWSPRADALRKLDCRKVTIDLLGKVHEAHD